MKRAAFVTVSLILFAFATVHAQVPTGQGGPPGAPPGGEIHGSVLDPDGAPIYGASVAVHSTIDSALVSGDIAGRDGSFQVQGLSPGTYYLEITSIGYEARRSPDLTIGPGAPRADAGAIRMAPAPVAVEGIDVTVERPTVAIEPDRNSYSAKDVAPAAATASEVLSAVPSVNVDPEGKVSLRGNENVAVQINGRPAPISGDQLGAYLEQLPANVIDRVEVVPTPSARYDPEGMAGIINIVLKQNTDLGTSGGLTLGASPSNRYNVSGNLGYQNGPWTTFTTYGFNFGQRDIDGINDRLRFDPLDVLLSTTEQDVLGENTFAGHNLSTTIDYKLSDKDVLSNILSLNLRGRDEESRSFYTELDADGVPFDQYARLQDGESDGRVLDYTLAFKRTLEARTHELAAEVRLNQENDDDVTLLWREPEGDVEPVTQTERELREVDAVDREAIAQVDYTRPLGENTKLETGYKGEWNWLERDYNVLEDELGTGEFVESDLSNAFDFDEQVQAAYAVLSRTIGKLQLQGGLRAEYAWRDFVLADDGDSFPYSYGSVFPSGVVSYNLTEADEAKISYSRRIRRPGSQELNPFPFFFDVQNVFIGNPELDPEYTDAIELGFTHQADWGSLQLSPFYRRTTDVIRFIVDTDDVVDGREVTSVSFENLDKGDSWGTDVNLSYEYGGWLNGMANFNVFKMVTEGGSEASLASNAVTWSTRLNATAELTPSLSLQGMMMYRAPMEFETGKFSSFKMTSLTLRQKLAGDRASLSLRVVDPFDTMGFRVEAADDNIRQITERNFDARSVHLTFQYTFGKPPRVRQPRPDAGADQGGAPGFPQ
ncbi:MAG TPA: TonB-dependent receptor [Gemmatimonadota bacterium]|nr:TonB-dependent receptor [Gemmatimonadota bacterium]